MNRPAASNRRVLVLMRHAHASPGSPDVERPLTDRGRHAAKNVGRNLAELEVRPGRVLCSRARRARETWAEVEGELESPAAEIVDALYLASTSTLLDTIRNTPPEIRVLMIVGHNPDLSVLARALCAESTPGFGLGEAVVLESEAETWALAASGTLELAARVP